MKKPSEVKEMILKFTYLIPFSGFYVMTFCDKMLVRKGNKDHWEMGEKNGYNDVVRNHELTHVKQAVSTKDSWFVFYSKYIWRYLKNIPIINGFKMPYKFISFELEAYANENNLEYAKSFENGTENWKKYDKLTLKQKKDLYKQYKSSRLSFSTFVRTYVDPLVK